jgi:hypothetical protein
MKSLIRYGGLVFGIGYSVLFFGFLAIFLEGAVRTSLSILSIPPERIPAAVFLFLVVVCGIEFGVSVIENSNRQGSNATLSDFSLPVTAFSLMLLFTGLALAFLVLWNPLIRLRTSLFLTAYFPPSGFLHQAV